MNEHEPGEHPTYSAFSGYTPLASGPLEAVLPTLKERFDRDPGEPVLVFEEWSGRQVDFDLRGSLREVIARAIPAPPRSGPGRPKLGVVAREISLLPRHWEWLERQPSGASAALRRLVDNARRVQQESDGHSARQAREALGHLLTAVAGNLPGYEEATRALYAVDRAAFEANIANWPVPLRDYLQSRASEAFWTKR